MQPDIDRYKQTFMQLNPRITPAEWAYFETGLTVDQYKPRDHYIEADRPNHRLGFVTRGLVRGYYISDAGEDITTLFIPELDWATDYPSLLDNRPSRYNFQCLEPTTIVSVDMAHIRSGYNRFMGFERNGRLIAEAVLTKQQHRIESFQFDTAEQRYLDFIRDNPALFNRISLTHLSTYLGIERPSLSRIRRKLAGL